MLRRKITTIILSLILAFSMSLTIVSADTIRITDSLGNIQPHKESPAALKAAESLPEKYDAREEGIITPVKDQENTTMCWAFSAISASEASVAKEGLLKNPDFSEEHLAYFFYNRLSDPLGNTVGDKNILAQNVEYIGSGNNLLAGISLATWSGPVNESLFPWSNGKDTSVKPTRSLQYGKNAVTLQNMKYMQTQDGGQLKKLIFQYGAVSACLYMPQSQEEIDKYIEMNPDSMSDCCKDKTTTNHALTIIGWDDRYSSDHFNKAAGVKEDGAWLVKDNYIDSMAYFYVSYEDTSLSSFVTFDYQAADTYDYNYQYDGTSMNTAITALEKRDFANVYSVKGAENRDELLKAVGVFIWSPDTAYEVQIYTDLQDPDDPSSGTKAWKEPVKCRTDYGGYYTIELPESVSLNQNTLYSVVVSLPKGASIGSEQSVDMGFAYFRAAMANHQSFYGSSDGKWVDLAKIERCARIKGFTKASAVDTSEPITALSLNKTSAKIKKDQNLSLRTTFAPVSGTGRLLEWTSSNNSVASVSSGGVVAGKKVGRSTITVSLKSNPDIKAQCILTVGYTIKYQTGGGKLAKGSHTVYYNEKISLKKPTRKGYTFKGWYTDKKCTKQITTIKKGSKKNYTLYAKWIKNG